MDIEWLDNMIPWERKIYIKMIEDYVKEKNEEIKRQNQVAGHTQGIVEHP